MNPPRSTPRGPITGEQLREAERGFLAMLRAKRFPSAWIDKNALDLLAQASSEYARWLKSHEAEENPVGWLIVCAYRRALNLLDSEGRRPPTTSIDGGFDLADEQAPTPEQEVLDHERQRRVQEAIRALPAKDQRLISLHYFEECSVREAGRRVGWSKSAADRHHRDALERLRSILGDDRDLLSPSSLGLAAWVVLIERAHGSTLLRRLGGVARRFLPLAEPGGLAASGGMGRAIGVCGAGLAAAACGLMVAGVQPVLPGSTSDPTPQSSAHRPQAGVGRAAASPSTSDQAVIGHKESERSSKSPPRRRSAAPKRSTDGRGRQGPSSAERVEAKPKREPAAEEPVVEEFGVEATPEAAPVEESAPAPTPTAETPPSASEPAHGRASAASKEFGL